MHEFSIVSSIVAAVLGFAEKHEAKKILEVRLTIGKLTHLQVEQVKFCYTAIATATALEGSILEVEETEPEVWCPHCSYRGAPKYFEGAFNFIQVPTLQCPACGNATEAMKGNECAIKNVKFVA
jgi:hydrogenase nickel incorporation protein HypA/HybF